MVLVTRITAILMSMVLEIQRRWFYCVKNQRRMRAWSTMPMTVMMPMHSLFQTRMNSVMKKTTIVIL